jgi:DUF1680 family protein
VNNRAEGGARAPWFDVSCCPTNVARTLASFGAYVAAADDEGISVLQYAAGDVRLSGFHVRVETDYPRSGTIVLRVVEAPAGQARLRLRIPGWAGTATIRLNDDDAASVASGWADVRRTFAVGDRLTLELPLHPRLTWPDERIDAVRGTVAVERGPLVLCAESTDLPEGANIDTVWIRADGALEDHADGARVAAELIAAPLAAGPLPYSASSPHRGAPQPVELTLVPYHRWAERGPSTMRIFLPVVG